MARGMGRTSEILRSARLAKRIAVECFGVENVGRLYVDSDPEDGERHLVLDARIGPGVDEGLRKYNHYIEQMVRYIPRDLLYLMRLSYNVYD